MIDTAGTICNAAQLAMERGAKNVICIATHPVLSGNSVQRLIESDIEKVIITDTIELPKDKLFDKLEIISVGEVFGESIKRINSGQSLSSMFRL